MNPAPLILVCDHRGEGLAEKVSALASEGYRLELTRGLRQTLERLARLEVNVVVIDPLASGGGVELDAVKRARPKTWPVPVLVVADTRDPLPALVGARTLEGAPWDLIRRDAPPEEFLLRIGLLKAQVERELEMSVLRHRATHDDRTDLLRPHSFQERLREHFSAAQRHGLDLALLMLDLDKFGQINKLFDHTIGDLVIVQVGNAIRAALRAEDVAGRLGGDEFAVLLPYTKKVDAAHVVQRLLEEIRGLTGRVSGLAPDTPISASIGFETFNGSDLDSEVTLRLHTEEALSQAKRRGGDQGVYYRSLESEGQEPPPSSDG